MTAIIAELWLPLPGYEDAYDVSDWGSIRRTKPGKGTRVGRILRTRIRRSPSGVAYRYIDLRGRSPLVHRLVALAFHGAPPTPEHEVRHLDGDSLNNCADNLRWGTKSENMRDRVQHGSDPNARKTHCRNGHPYTPENTYRTPQGHRACRICLNAAAQRHRWRISGRSVPYVPREWTHCGQGHPFDSENTYINPRGGRECKACRADAARRYRERKRAL